MKKTKECTIDIYSGKIGIDEPNEHDKDGDCSTSIKFRMSNNRQKYDIFELSLKFKKLWNIIKNSHIDLEPDNKITKNFIKELMKEIINNEK